MSLIYFHIILISAAVVFAFGVCFWELNVFAKSHQMMDLWTGIGSLVFAFFAAWYLIWFIVRKKPAMTRSTRTNS